MLIQTKLLGMNKQRGIEKPEIGIETAFLTIFLLGNVKYYFTLSMSLKLPKL